MRKKVIILSILFASLPILFSVYRIYEYYHYLRVSPDRIKRLNEEVSKIDKEIVELSKENSEIYFNHSEDIKVLELWEKRLEDLEKEL